MLSNSTTFAAIGAAIGEIYWNNCGIGPSSHALSEKPIQLNQLMYARASSFPAPHAA